MLLGGHKFILLTDCKELNHELLTTLLHRSSHSPGNQDSSGYRLQTANHSNITETVHMRSKS